METFEYMVEGCTRATYDEPYVWEPIAYFRYKGDAENFIRMQGNINGESALVDQMEVRLVSLKN